MASQLSGISRESFTLVRRNVVPLIIATMLPVLLMAAFGAANIVISLNEALTAQSSGAGSVPAGTSTASLVRFFAFGFAGLFFYCWMVAKVSRLCLTGETATIIGSGGSLRAGFWILLYYIAAALVLLIPILVVLVLMSVFDFSFVGKIIAGLGVGKMILTAVFVLSVVLCFGWAQCRFIVGFPPLALGEKPSLFNGWILSRGCSFGLFGRVLLALLLLTVGMILVLEALGWILPLLLSGESLTGAGSGGASALLLVTVLVPQLLTLVLSVPVYWYLVVLFCVAYQRCAR